MMILLLCRRRIAGTVVFLLTAITILSLAARPPAVPAFSYAALPTMETIILDAGHGGADGGAVAADGTAESGINLAVALRLRDVFALLGCETIMTRTDEGSLADADSETLRQQKVSDTKNRVALINSVTNSRLISIHQNTLAGHPEVHGAQVFFGKVEGSSERAAAVQQTLNKVINIGNEKTAKPIGSDVYIMSHAQCPAILVECGFLSNEAEAAQLMKEEYQKVLALSIAGGYSQHVS